MAQLLAVISAIGTIVSTLRAINNARELLAGNASSAITLNDAQRMVRSETVQFFRAVEVARLREVRRQFYTIWLPSVANRPSIQQADVAANGALFGIWQTLNREVVLVGQRIGTLATVFHQYSDVLHVDDLVCGQGVLIELTGCLLHMQSVLATLNQHRIGASSLDAPDLAPDTHATIAFAENARDIFQQWLARLTQQKRMDQIEPIQSRYSSGGRHTPPHTQWWFDDRYSALRTTPAERQVGVQPARHSLGTDRNANAQSIITYARVHHVRLVQARYSNAVGEAAQRFLGELNTLLQFMYRRRQMQTGGRFPQGRHARRFPRWAPPRRRPRALGQAVSAVANLWGYRGGAASAFGPDNDEPFARTFEEPEGEIDELAEFRNLALDGHTRVGMLPSCSRSEDDLPNVALFEGELSKCLRRSSSMPELHAPIFVIDESTADPEWGSDD